MSQESQTPPILCLDPVYSRFLLRPHLGLVKLCKLLQGVNPMETQNIIKDFDEDSRNIRGQIKELEADLQAIERLKRRYSQNSDPAPSSQSKSHGLLSTPTGNPSLKPKEAGKHLVIQAGSTRIWRPTQMRDDLVKLRGEGRLLSKTEDLLPPSHEILKSLVKDGLMVKAGKGKYRMAEKTA